MKRIMLWLIPPIVLGAVAAYYFWPEKPTSAPESISTPAPAAEPAIRYPVESIDAPATPLPPLTESDEALNAAFSALLGKNPPKFLYLNQIIQRIVATVDNLPRDHVAPRLMPVKPVPGVPITVNSRDNLALGPKNAERYQPYVNFMTAIPIDSAVALYARFYPLFQEQYEKLGYPGKYFNDRAVEVIDHLLAAPEVDGPVRLVQPRVLYEFADPKLEQLSAGQKILLRIGRANAVKVKEKLNEIRQALVSMKPQ